MSEGVAESVIPPNNENDPTFCHSLYVSPIDILKSQSVGDLNFELEIGDLNDGMYISNVNDVACRNEICNKRNSNAGPEWSARRLGNRPLGASDAVRNSEMCLGAYAILIGYNQLTRATTPVIQDKHRQEEPDMKINTAPASQEQVL